MTQPANTPAAPAPAAVSYDFQSVEPRWQKAWDEASIFTVPDVPPADRPKYYVLEMFPYPSGQLHMGHVRNYALGDVIARYKRARGYAVLHPMGWDAFGLPAENAARERGVHPQEWTLNNIAAMRTTLQRLGFSLNWDREIATCLPDYYGKQQKLFLDFLQAGLVERRESWVNWDPVDQTVLANEQVVDGRGWRSGAPIEKKQLSQWFLKITDFAEDLLDGLKTLDRWPDRVRTMQERWIGRSEGARVRFSLHAPPHGLDPNLNAVEVFTTRPDTLFGATYMVLAPEHQLVSKITTPEQAAEVKAYQEEVSRKSDLERTDLNKDKSGVFTGAYGINPMTGKEVPIWIGDYVLESYGTGAIMAVPAHDDRDYDFAKKFGLPIVPVIEGGNTDEAAYTGDGPHFNSGFMDGMGKDDAIKAAIDWLTDHKAGHEKVNYRLRDWIFSRQRYWGEPIPIIHWEDGETNLVPEDQLPLLLPHAKNIKPSGTPESPLANLTDWVNVVDKNGRKGKRETNTMPNWAGSSWYYIRYVDPHNDKEIANYDLLKQWLPVDLYIGGAEHAVRHLLYARFWHKVLYDLGVVPTKEPFKRLYNQGLILKNHEKMSKSKGNVVNPDDVIDEYGADSLRMYEMFMGPLDASIDWDDNGPASTKKFLDRVWRLFVNDLDLKAIPQEKIVDKNDGTLDKVYNETVKKVTEDFDALHFNTAISQMMVFVNAAQKAKTIPREYAEGFIKLLAPVAPHMMEEIWSVYGHNHSITYAKWPTYDPSKLVESTVRIMVQVNGKLRGKFQTAKDTAKDDLQKQATALPHVQKFLKDKDIKKVIVIPNKIVNIVAK